MFFSIMDINILENSVLISHKTSNLTQNPLNNLFTLKKGLIVYAQQDISLTGYQTTKYGINESTEIKMLSMQTT